MIKFKQHFREALDYLRKINASSKIWYMIRDNFYKWYVEAFTYDSVGIDMLYKYLKKFNYFEEPKYFWNNMVEKVLFLNLLKNDQIKVMELAKQVFLDGLLLFEEQYALQVMDIDILNKLKKENVLIEDEGKLRFQNIILFTYLAATEINQEEIKISDDIFDKWSDCEYWNNEIKIYYIFSMINATKFNSEFVKPKLDDFLRKVDSTSNIAIVQSILKMCDITQTLKGDYDEISGNTQVNSELIRFLGLEIEETILEHNFDEYESMLRLKYLNQNEEVVLDYTKTKQDKLLLKFLDEDGSLDELVSTYKKLIKIAKMMDKDISKDYCNYWEIKENRKY